MSDEYAAKEVAFNDAREQAELPRALDALEKRLEEAHDRLAALRERILPILLHDQDEKPSHAEPTMAAIPPTRSEVSERLWSMESRVAALTTRMVETLHRVDL